MFTTNPFDAITSLISTDVMQMYVILMAVLVAAGTILDMMHKKSAKYFFENAQKAQKNAKRTVSTGEKAGLAVATIANEVLTSGEFSNPKRRLSHLLTMYGFIIFVASSALIIFGCDTFATTTLAQAWHIGALMLAIGGYWFWFFIRVDVNSEGVKWYQLRRADIFIVSLLLTATFALIWSYLQHKGTTGAVADMGWTTLFFAFFIISNTVLFSTVMWSKFAHMFFKPAAAFQKRVAHADGSNENLPGDFDLSSPEVQARFPDIPEYMGKNPENMGAGIRREAANHY
ncbi:MAG: adenylyl-sulfate reductase [Gammaproteobacteria bacterium]|nr:adenylyl-sulfate reductase [Gammaproteobacteria bacterium]MDH5659519.1 adenylyl-sulfate reductase [Gammaproteobacteria bacterium]